MSSIPVFCHFCISDSLFDNDYRYALKKDMKYSMERIKMQDRI